MPAARRDAILKKEPCLVLLALNPDRIKKKHKNDWVSYLKYSIIEYFRERSARTILIWSKPEQYISVSLNSGLIKKSSVDSSKVFTRASTSRAWLTVFRIETKDRRSENQNTSATSDRRQEKGCHQKLEEFVAWRLLGGVVIEKEESKLETVSTQFQVSRSKSNFYAKNLFRIVLINHGLSTDDLFKEQIAEKMCHVLRSSGPPLLLQLDKTD